MKPNLEQIQNNLTSPWDKGNKVLYDLCRDNFYHKETGEILAKVWLIGRAYSAAIERRKNKKEENDEFYIGKVAPKFISSGIDDDLDKLKSQTRLTTDNLLQVLTLHKKLTDITFEITELEKRSFCSKYLHFHLPDLFFIYDSRVVEAMRAFITKAPTEMESFIKSDQVDTEYATFVCKSIILREKIKSQHNIDLTLRQVDNILIEYTNEKAKEKLKTEPKLNRFV